MTPVIGVHNIQDGFYRLSRILGTMNEDTVSFCVADEFLEIFFEVLHYLCTDGVGLLAPFTPIGQRGERGNTPCHAALGVGV